MKKFLIILSFFSFTGLWAQGVTITGHIVDAETLDPLPFAHVFFDQTTIGSVSDSNGDYIIEHVEKGDYKIVFSFVGYEIYSVALSVGNTDIRISARLVPSKAMLEAVEVKGTQDKEWEKQLTQFKKVFFGTNELAKECKILNPWVLDFTVQWDKTFKATASEAIKIENKALGYNIECTLQGFSFNKDGYKIKGLYRFEEVNTLDKKEAAKWTRNRRQAYQNSLQFLCKSIIENHESENGFNLYDDLRPDLRTETSGYFSHELGKTRVEYKAKEHIQPMGRPGYYKITIDNRLEIHHTTQFAHTKTYRDMINPVSWIEVEKGYILASQEGNIINNEDITTSGELNNNRIAAMLPSNYTPGSIVVINYITKRAHAKRLREKVFVQTDKGYYYPGETVWYKAYMSYANPAIKDSLSKVLYVDLIDPSKGVIQSKILKLDSAFAWGEFLLDSNAVPGIYGIRAYTRWMMNYGPDIIFYKPFVVTPQALAIKTKEIVPTENDFMISVSRDRFNGPGKIQVRVLLDSTQHDSIANCSISVIPAYLQLPVAQDIQEALFIPEDLPQGTLADFVHPLEYSFSVKGQLYRKNKKNTSGTVTIIEGMMDSVYQFRTNKKGFFIIDNLNFCDTITFNFQGKNRKGRNFGNVRLVDQSKPIMNFPSIRRRQLNMDTTVLDYPIHVSSPLTEKAIPEKQETVRNYDRPVSSADYVLGPRELELIPEGTSILDALVGRVPGLSINAQTGMLSLGRGLNNKDSEPLMVLDGIPLNLGNSYITPKTDISRSTESSQAVQYDNNNQNKESSPLNDGNSNRSGQNANQMVTTTNQAMQPGSTTARDLVGHVLVEFVAKVEISQRSDARFGSGNLNGVIVITTQKIPRRKVVHSMESFIIEGFVRPNPFVPCSLQSIGKSYNPLTIYWNPSINISAARQTKFFVETPHSAGTYLIRIEGIDSAGNPVSGSAIFNLEEKIVDQTKARF